MKIIGINGCDEGSTGNIATEILKFARDMHGCEVSLVCPFPKRKDIKTFNANFSYITYQCSRLLNKVIGMDGFLNFLNTVKVIRYLKREKPDIVHLHVLHGNYINAKKIVDYCNKRDVPVVWTFHDCWAFTGKCPNFLYNNCSKWETGCYKCRYFKQYPKSYFFDFTKKMFLLKKNMFFSSSNITIVSVSKWLDSLVSKSLCTSRKHLTISNGCNFPQTNLIVNEKPFDLICASSPWSVKKGLTDLFCLAKFIDEHELNINILVIGYTDENIPYKCIKSVGRVDHDSVISLFRKSKVLLSLSYEETFGLTVIEGFSEGLPAIVVKGSGGPETIVNSQSGIVVDNRNPETIISAFETIRSNYDNYCNFAKKESKKYSNEEMCNRYWQLYKNIKN